MMNTSLFPEMQRVVVGFSCGVASTVALKLALDKYGAKKVVALYTDPGSEHPSNPGYLWQVENALGIEIKKLKSPHYNDTWDVFTKHRFLSFKQNAKCTHELKRKVRESFARPDDINIFGFTIEETKRHLQLQNNEPKMHIDPILIEARITKSDCFRIIAKLGIKLPTMYRLGYKNNNCIGCVKGGMGYWNRIRYHFPDDFKRMAELERELGVSVIHRSEKGQPVEQIFLDTLHPKVGNYKAEPSMSCGLLCSLDEAE